MPKPLNPEKYIGSKYGRLTAVAFIGIHTTPSGYRKQMFRFECECGNSLETDIYRCRGGNTNSCGCLRKDMMTKHGQASARTPEYRAWEHMVSRGTSASHQNAKDYVSRGIGVAPEWLGDGGFERFLSHIGLKPSPAHTIERIDNDKGYCPGNVRWATRHEQARNRRTNRFVDVDGQRMCVKDACVALGLKYTRVLARLRNGWDEARALNR